VAKKTRHLFLKKVTSNANTVLKTRRPTPKKKVGRNRNNITKNANMSDQKRAKKKKMGTISASTEPTKTAQLSRSTRAGLKFPIPRTTTYLRKTLPHKVRVGANAGTFLTAVLEYLTAEVLELAGNATKDNKKKRITARFITLAVRQDEELTKQLPGLIFSGGVIPHIHPTLVPKKKKKKKQEQLKKKKKKKK
jgi:histone H2A